MSARSRRLWAVVFLGALSLAAGFAWGRLRDAGGHSPDAGRPPQRPEPGERESETTTRDAPVLPRPPPAGSAAPAIEPPEPALPALQPEADLVEASELIESLTSATPQEIARLPWDGRVRGALDKLRVRAPGGHRSDSGLPPAVLVEILSTLLERASLPLTASQHARLDELAADRDIEIERQLADLGDGALALERELCVISATDDLLEATAALLDGRQLDQLDAWTPETLEWPPLLSPLTSAPIQRRELRLEELPALRDGLSGELAREFGLDPADGDRFAIVFLREIEALLAPPSHRSEMVERVVALGEAQARLYRELLAHPAIDDAARRRIQAERRWLVPVLAR